MRFTSLSLPDVMRIDLDPIADERGFFARLFCRDELRQHGIAFEVVQCNNTFTRQRGSIRGLHFQRPPKAEYKIVRCVRGAILDVAIDLRRDSATFGQHCSCELNDNNRSMMLIPPGFGHGFQTLVDDTELIYLHSESYSRQHEGGVQPTGPEVAIAWPLPIGDISVRDQQLPSLTHLEPIQL